MWQEGRCDRKEELSVKDFRYRLSVHDCRAIKSAEIDLAEITVLTGVNASGKSTIARMLRDLVEMSAEYERLLAVQTWKARMSLWAYAVGARWRLSEIESCLARGETSLQDAVSALEKILRDALRCDSQRQPASRLAMRIRRLFNLSEDKGDVMEFFSEVADKALEKFRQRRATRTYAVYKDLMKANPLFEGKVSLNEGERTVFSNDRGSDTLEEISFIKRAIYVESPFKSVPGRATSAELDMGDAYTRIGGVAMSASGHGLGELAKVLEGSVDFESDMGEADEEVARALFGRSGRWVYRRRDGGAFDLDECATGIRSLSILDILHSKGWLDAETLLVIDEPEAHLHPQWIVEYARILLLLSRRLRVRIFVTSHSPDMVNALHTIGTSMGMGDDIGFYLAERDDAEPYRFNYRALGNRVGDIFKAYNVSFARIDDYASCAEKDRKP